MTSTRKLLVLTLFLFLAGGAVFASLLYTPARRATTNTSLAETSVKIAAPQTETESNTAPEETLLEPETVARPLSILAVGDIMLGRYVQTLMEQRGEDYPFEKIGDLFTSHDVVLANLEGPIIDGPKTPNNSLIFRFPETTAALLARHGITHVSLANNHTMNQGQEGLANTRTLLANENITTFGDPASEEIGRATTSHNTFKSIEWIGVNAALRSVDREHIIQRINEATDPIGAPDFVVVFVHWGNEYQHTPSAVQRELAHEWIDAGADVVIGQHPHVIQTVELYNDHLIFYSLGNFIFDQYFSEDTQEMLAVNLLLEDETVTAKLIPLNSSRSQPQTADENRRTDILRKLADWSDARIRDAILKGEFVLRRTP
ncbi:MAG: CapA family protein [Candidatus Kerfeldbacteria bacterium]|nr:CapA family protein [Candidatus Kerfeldbacteria bacterium]